MSIIIDKQTLQTMKENAVKDKLYNLIISYLEEIVDRISIIRADFTGGRDLEDILKDLDL